MPSAGSEWQVTRVTSSLLGSSAQRTVRS